MICGWIAKWGPTSIDLPQQNFVFAVEGRFVNKAGSYSTGSARYRAVASWGKGPYGGLQLQFRIDPKPLTLTGTRYDFYPIHVEWVTDHALFQWDAPKGGADLWHFSRWVPAS